MSETATIGYGAIALALLATTVTGLSALIAACGGGQRYRSAAEYGAFLISTIYGVAATAMIHAFIHQDYSLLYVYQYSDASMPWIYQLTAFWGGQAGSLMFWATILSIFLALVTLVHRKRDPGLMMWFIVVMTFVLLFFNAILLFVSNPFETFSIIDAPADGRGLNPQLQVITMVIHPPSLLAGYVSATVPFAFAVAGLLSGRLDDGWLKATRKWTLISWAFLSVGLILGMLWAYTELGWGGYWAWDPVENAAFIPWLVMTAFLHSAVIQEKRGMLKRWNMILVLLTWLLTIFGTFLTRSGLIASVHSFAQSDIGDYFLWYLVAMTILSVGLLVWRWGRLKSTNEIESPLSREFVFLFNNWFLLAAAGVVLFGTLYPKLKEMVTGDTASLGPPWFNQWMSPIGIGLLMLTGVGVMISWRRATAKNFRRNFVKPLLFAGAVTAILPPTYYYLRVESMGVEPELLDGLYGLVALFACSFVVGTIGLEFWRGTRVRMSKLGVGPLTALTGLVMRNQRRYGGYIVHLGIVLLIFGFIGNTFRVEQQVVLSVGDRAPLGDYIVEVENITEEHDPEKLKMFADVNLIRDGEVISQVRPGRFFYYASEAATSEVDIRSTPFEDVYFAVINYDINEGVVALMMVINPFVWWIWMGGIVLVFGTLLCMWPVDRTPKKKRRGRRRISRKMLVGIVSLLVWPLMILATVSTADASEDHEDSDPSPEVESIQVYDPATQSVFDLIKCECPNCGGLPISRCRPTCYEGRRDRDRVVAMLDKGFSKDDVVAAYVEERGEAAVTKPPMKGFNHFTWILPIAGILVAVPVLMVVARNRRRDPEEEEEAEARASEGGGGAPDVDPVDLSEGDDDRLDELDRVLEEME